MNFLALLLGLGVERVLTRLFHLREFRWLDPLFDFVFNRLKGASRAGAVVELTVLALLLTVPVIYAGAMLSGESLQIAFFIFAIVILLFSLGPRDLPQEVQDYCAALEASATEDVRRLARELSEHDPPADPAAAQSDIERAIYVQANNRIFGVVFWFVVLGPAGPAGAWLFRVTDLMRRRAVYRAPGDAVLAAARVVHGVLAWIPARLMVMSFALAGGFDDAVSAWRAKPDGESGPFFERTDELIARLGSNARRRARRPEPESEVTPQATRSAMALVRRAIWLIWYPAIALLTLNNWLR